MGHFKQLEYLPAATSASLTKVVLICQEDADPTVKLVFATPGTNSLGKTMDTD